MNIVNLIGRITKDLELRSTANGQGKFVSFTLAVSEYSGQKEITNFIPCFAFSNNAENMVKYLSKGSLIAVQGRVNVRTSQTDGKYETITTITADHISFLDTKKKNNENIQTFENKNYNKESLIANGNITFNNDNPFEENEAVMDWD